MREIIYTKEEMADRILSALSFKRKLLGFGYLREAVLIACRYPDGRAVLSREVYPVIAERHGKNTRSVEHAIRNAINICFYHGNLKNVNIFLHSNVVNVNYPPTNGEFIISIAAFLFRLKEEDFAQLIYILNNLPKDKK